MLLRYQPKAGGQLHAAVLKGVLPKDSVQTVGRRKTATAVVRVCSGSGLITVNKRPFVEYFSRTEDRHQVLYPLLVTKSLDVYDIHVYVHGGGPTGEVLCLGSAQGFTVLVMQVRQELFGWQ